ncbi:MAG: signal peptidase I [Patescibacteria group bacterium]|nr:signal peptidase I [Patescibacteria group bacterium]
MKNKALKIYTTAFKLWLIAILIFILCIAFGTNGFRTDVQNTLFGKSQFFLPIFIGSIILGLIAFLIGVLSLTSFLVLRKRIKNKFLKLLLFIGILLILPIYILISWFIKGLKLLKNKKINLGLIKKENFTKLINVLFVIIFLLPIWIIGYFLLGYLTVQIVQSELGYTRQIETISLTGSMYPTFPRSDKKDLKEQAKETFAAANFISYPTGIVLFGNRYFGRDLKRGDIIVFENKKTDEVTQEQYGVPSGFVKRIIALSGDTIELREGIVYLNGKALKEQYTYKPRSTFAESFISECKVIKVPKDNVFAMGDNRKGSGDSREIGFINFKDVSLVLPIEDQKGTLDKNWRSTSKDFDESSKLKINKDKYLELINQKRKEARVQLLKYQPKLEKSAELRGETILKFDDFSYEATRSGYTMYKAMADANYSNITYGEAPAQGYFEADELIDNQFQFPKTKEFLLNKDFQEIGISEVEGKINNCPTQVIIQHFAGYVPPNYTKDVIESWENSLSGLRNIQSGWQDLKHYPQIYDKNKGDIDRINDIISQRISMTEGVVAKMKANQWLSPEQEKYTRTTDKALADEENSLADKLNNAQ